MPSSRPPRGSDHAPGAALEVDPDPLRPAAVASRRSLRRIALCLAAVLGTSRRLGRGGRRRSLRALQSWRYGSTGTTSSISTNRPRRRGPIAGSTPFTSSRARNSSAPCCSSASATGSIPLKLAESEIILRATGFLNPVNISASAVPGGAEVLVETHDQWSTGVTLSFGMSGNRRSATFGLSEDNLLGLGKSFLFEVKSDPERTSTKFGYKDITFLRSRWQLELEHQSSSDGSTDHFRIEYPFFSLTTPRAGGVDWQREESP